ncbi:MAG: hypothetical protein AAGA48_04530 [Myxococcota bacterium]
MTPTSLAEPLVPAAPEAWKPLVSGDGEGLVAALNAAGLPQRMEFLESLTKADQRRMWEQAADNSPLTVEDLVPRDVPVGEPVIWHGFNTLPLPRFGRRFRKPMVRLPDGRIGGYNDSPFTPFIGPGYFITRACDDEEFEHSSVVIDYHQRPTDSVPEHWPWLRPNWLGLQLLVYFHTRDYLRRVSDDVVIGLATKYGNSLGNWFTLVRQP